MLSAVMGVRIPEIMAKKMTPQTRKPGAKTRNQTRQGKGAQVKPPRTHRQGGGKALVTPTDVSKREQVLAAVLAMIKGLTGKIDATPASLDGILGLKGVMEVTEQDESEEARRAAEAAVVAGFDQALADLVAKALVHETALSFGGPAGDSATTDRGWA